MLFSVITVSALLCLIPLAEAKYGCPPTLRGCGCRFGWVDDDYTYKTIVVCDGISGNVNDFKNNLKSLENYEIDELIINNYRIQELPEEPFTKTDIKRVTIRNSPLLEYLGGRQSTKTFFDNLGNSLESLVVNNAPAVRASEWSRISSSLANQPVIIPSTTTVSSTSSGGSSSGSPSDTTPPEGTEPSGTDSSATEPSGTASSGTGSTVGTNGTSSTNVTGTDTDTEGTNSITDSTENPENTPSTVDSSDPNSTTDTPIDSSTTTTLPSTIVNYCTLPSTTVSDSFERLLKSIESMARKSEGPVLKNLIMFRNSKTTVQGLNDFEPLTGIERVIMRSIGLSDEFTSDLTGFERIRLLDLSENKLTAFNSTLPENLSTIYLFNNQITTFDKEFLNNLDPVRYIDVRNNPLSCLCEDIQPIVDSQRLQGVFEGTCASPPSMRGRKFGKEGCYESDESGSEF